VRETPRPPGGSDRAGNSTWQSFARGSDSTEVDWLNGEIVLLGRLHGVPTPMNDLLCRVSRWAIRQRLQPRSLTVEQILHWSPPAG
jgi:2-dehydropantoate 2-reductase